MSGIKECAACDEHQVLYGLVETLYGTPETNINLELKEKHKIKRKGKKNSGVKISKFTNSGSMGTCLFVLLFYALLLFKYIPDY